MSKIKTFDNFLNEEKSQVEIDNPTLYPDGWKEMDGMFMRPKDWNPNQLDELALFDEEYMKAFRALHRALSDLAHQSPEVARYIHEHGDTKFTSSFKDDFEYEVTLKKA